MATYRASPLLLCVLSAALLVACASQGAGVNAEQQPAPAPDATWIEPNVELVLQRGPGRTWTASLVNRGKQSVQVVLPGDGSSGGKRTPITSWQVWANGEAIEQYAGQGCGNLNPLQPDEVVALHPGRSVSLNRYGLSRPRLPHGLPASVRLSYQNIPGLIWTGIGNHDPATMSRVRASTPLSLTSNVVEVAAAGGN